MAFCPVCSVELESETLIECGHCHTSFGEGSAYKPLTVKGEARSPVHPPPELWWLMCLVLLVVTGANALLAVTMAAFSLNMAVIHLSIAASILCAILVVRLSYKGRYGLALLFSFGAAPITVALALLLGSLRPAAAYVVEKVENARTSVVAWFNDPQPALDRAMQAGSIRKATAEDIDAFRRAFLDEKHDSSRLQMPDQDAKRQTARLEEILSQVDLSRAYVVLKNFVCPSGLVGKYRVVFFVPSGVVTPTGDWGESTIFLFEPPTIAFRTK